MLNIVTKFIIDELIFCSNV